MSRSLKDFLGSGRLAVMVLALVPTFLVVKMPILFPFADDWLIIEYSSGEKNLSFDESIQTVNGHQAVLSKLLLKSLSYFDEYNIQLISFSSLALAVIGVFLIIESQRKLLKSRIIAPIYVTMAVVGLNYKQMQNVFMPICNGWMIAIFFIGVFYYAKQLKDSWKRTLILCSCILLAPLSIGLGMILPLAQVVEDTYRIFKGNSVSKKSLTRVFSTLTVSILSCLLYLITKLTTSSDVSGISHDFNPSSLMSIFQNPILSLKFIFTLVGSSFVPASRFEPELPQTMGALIVVGATLILVVQRSRVNWEDIILNRSTLLGGLVYVLILFLFRFSGEEVDVAGIAAPRYVTGTMLVIIGLLGLIGTIKSHEAGLRIFLLVVSFSVLISGTKTGLEWHKTRNNQSQILIKCAKLDDFGKQGDCYKLAFKNSMTPNPEFFDIQLNKFVESQ